MFERLQESLTQLPLLARFAFAMTVFLTVPALCKRIHLPAVVGLLAAGVIFGPHGLQVGPKHNEVAEYFAEVGKLLLMFFAGLEIDAQQFHVREIDRSSLDWRHFRCRWPRALPSKWDSATAGLVCFNWLPVGIAHAPWLPYRPATGAGSQRGGHGDDWRDDLY